MKITRHNWDEICKLHQQPEETTWSYTHNNCIVNAIFGDKSIIVTLDYPDKDSYAEFWADPRLPYPHLISILDELSETLLNTTEPRLRLLADDVYKMFKG